MADVSRYPEYGDSLRRRAAAILRSDTEVDAIRARLVEHAASTPLYSSRLG